MSLKYFSQVWWSNLTQKNFLLFVIIQDLIRSFLLKLCLNLDLYMTTFFQRLNHKSVVINTFAPAVKLSISLPDLITFASFIKSRENRATFFGILLNLQFWADSDTTIHLAVRSDDGIFLMKPSSVCRQRAKLNFYFNRSNVF